MNFDCPLRGPATGARLEKLGLPEVHKNGRGAKTDLEKLRAYTKQMARKTGDTIGSMATHDYKRAFRKIFFAERDAERAARAKEREANMHSLNPQKAARMQALRQAWAKAKEAQS